MNIFAYDVDQNKKRVNNGDPDIIPGRHMALHLGPQIQNETKLFSTIF